MRARERVSRIARFAQKHRGEPIDGLLVKDRSRLITGDLTYQAGLARIGDLRREA